MSLCPVCDAIFSLYNDPSRVLDPQSCFGFHEALLDLYTGDQLCSRDSVIAHQYTKKVKLVRVLLLGQALQWRGAVWFLCPGQGCGLVTSLTTQHCVYSSTSGFLCSQCSLRSLGKHIVSGKKSKSARSLATVFRAHESGMASVV